MATTSVAAIEQAELLAEKTVTDAHAEKSQIIKSAQEKATLSSVAALEKAESQAAELIRKAQADSESQQSQAHNALHQELEKIKNTGLEKQSKAIEEILKLLPTLL